MEDVHAEVEWLEPETPFRGANAEVGQFWRWALSELTGTTELGFVAEFLVATACGATDQPRHNPRTVIPLEGRRVIVKSPVYGGRFPKTRYPMRRGDPQDAGASSSNIRSDDVVVFASLRGMTATGRDVLDVSKWSFRVVSGAIGAMLEERGGYVIDEVIAREHPRVRYDHLRDSILSMMATSE